MSTRGHSPTSSTRHIASRSKACRASYSTATACRRTRSSTSAISIASSQRCAPNCKRETAGSELYESTGLPRSYEGETPAKQELATLGTCYELSSRSRVSSPTTRSERPSSSSSCRSKGARSTAKCATSSTRSFPLTVDNGQGGIFRAHRALDSLQRGCCHVLGPRTRGPCRRNSRHLGSDPREEAEREGDLRHGDPIPGIPRRRSPRPRHPGSRLESEAVPRCPEGRADARQRRDRVRRVGGPARLPVRHAADRSVDPGRWPGR